MVEAGVGREKEQRKKAEGTQLCARCPQRQVEISDGKQNVESASS